MSILRDTWLARMLADKLKKEAATVPPLSSVESSKPVNSPEVAKSGGLFLSESVLAKFAPRAVQFMDGLNQCASKYQINTPKRMAAFLGQLHIESGAFRYVREIWGPTDWQKKYEGHKGLGNLQPGDGKRFMGRGLIQVTGRSNYRACSVALFGDTRLWDKPELLEQPDNAVLSAGWYWDSRKLNDYADGWDLDAITRLINGKGMLHHKERVAQSERALKLLT